MITSLQEFFMNQSAPVSPLAFIMNLILAWVLSSILGYVYVHCAQSFSDRKRLANNFVILSMTTMIIITIVKSSLALSLGLVGALSIVRFRSAIKEPEELTYLFFSIALGLGLGANQVPITLIGFFIIIAVTYLQRFRRSIERNPNIVCNIAIDGGDEFQAEKMVDILSKYCSRVNLRRFDESDSSAEASFHIEIAAFDDLMKVKEELKTHFAKAHISFLDNKGLV